MTPDEFGKIILRANPDGSILHLSRTWLASSSAIRPTGFPAATTRIAFRHYGDLSATRFKRGSDRRGRECQRMKELSAKSFSACHFAYDVPLDTTKAVTAREFNEIVFTLA